MDRHYTAAQTAANFRILSELVASLWPNESTRPKLIGPDVHGFHGNPNNSKADRQKLQYLTDFVRNCSHMHVDLHAATHHEYIEVEPYSSVPPNSSVLQITSEVASAVNASLALAAPSVQIWAGEIGPHNGGKEGHKPAACGQDQRWANFADSQWYLDAMGAKAVNGYQVFCRQVKVWFSLLQLGGCQCLLGVKNHMLRIIILRCSDDGVVRRTLLGLTMV